ncbi:MerR family transcriptional regulator [Sporosarcina sp. A2]|uniref:MerR family transcriptional regulator n=1 Tax=Sporosarcina sp. A2 TaxID=3393449 RepID=UPI003D78E70F
MKKQDQILFTAGQFANLHNINKRTLHYYDDIKLFSPVQVGENGYRYYSYSQSPTLEMLLTLRELNMSIDEVSSFMANRSAESFHEILRSKTAEIDANIDRLRQLKKLLTSKERMLSLAEHSEVNQLELIDCKEELLILGPSLSGVEDEEYLDILMADSKTMRDSRFFNKTYGTMISSEKLIAHNFDEYECFFTKVDKKPKELHAFVKPSGRYIQAFCKGNWDRLPETYENILNFAKEQGVTLTGFSYEVGINEMVINSIDEYITHILVQCK